MMGLGIVTELENRWVFGSFLCQLTGFLNNVALVNSLWTVALGSIDRCFAIRVPFKHRYIQLGSVFLNAMFSAEAMSGDSGINVAFAFGDSDNRSLND
eukprot:sb/3478930/